MTLVEPWVVASLALSLAWFLTGALRLHGRGAYVRPLARQTGCFLAGCAVLMIALSSPLDAVADRSFAAHMHSCGPTSTPFGR